MQINRLETHDRLLEFQKQAELIAQGVQDCIDNVPDTINTPFYIFGHPRTLGMDEKLDIALSNGIADPNQIPSTRMVWMPRIEKPRAVLNSYLFKATKGTDVIRIIWILPPRELWDSFKPGQMTHNDTVWTCIQNYEHAKNEMEAPEPDDLNEDQKLDFIKKIRQAAIDKRRKKVTGIDEWEKIQF